MEQIPNHVILSHWRQLVHKVMQRKVHFQLLLINDIIFTVFGKNLCFCASMSFKGRHIDRILHQTNCFKTTN